jgi:hypothetical protein
MTVNILACPECKSLVLPDTAQCPNCHFVFDEKRIPAEISPADRVEVNDEEVPCPGCNELVRKGLVRCWNCGTFMQQDIAESYRRMQISPPKVIYSDPSNSVPEADGFSGSVSDSGRLVDAPARGAMLDNDDEADFEVMGESADGVGVDLDEEDFDLGASERPAAQNEIVQSAPTFTIREPEDEPTPAPAAKPAKAEKTAEKPAPKAAAKEAPPAPAAKPGKHDSQHEFSNEFENRFGIDEAGAGGDVLLRVALAEEAEHGVRRRSQRVTEGKPRTGFRIYCPNGHCIEVQERHRGQTGRCPRCRQLYHVPAGNWDEDKAIQDDKVQNAVAITAAVNAQTAADKPVEISAGEYTRWMLDSHFHSIDLSKLKLKAGSLLKDFQEADIGFAPDGMLLVLLSKKGGLFGGGDKKKLATRDAVLDHLSKGKARADLPAGANFFFPAADMQQIRIVQPIVSTEQSMFAGVPVFGDGQIAVRLPQKEEAGNPQFLSFALSQFRRFSQILDEFFGMKAFGADRVPLEDVFTERRCHFSDQELRILENLDYYKDDPGFKLAIIGYKCAGCGLVVSEDSRLKEKIGDKDAKKLAKTKCPKCQKPFGNQPLHSLETPSAS